MHTTHIALNLESGNLPMWAEHEANRLSKLATFKPGGWTAVGSARVYKKLNATLREAGVRGDWMHMVSRDICDAARLKAAAL
jgi:hypothetical protein